MELDEIKQHWQNWAQEYKSDIRATTKTRTIKELELSALFRAFKQTPFFLQDGIEVLEVGCGNGHNCFRLASMIPNFSFTGVDYIAEMIESAKAIKNSKTDYATIKFYVGDILELDKHSELKDRYAIVFTNRCLINLNYPELQYRALDQLIHKTAEGGYVVLIENISQSYARQNELRASVGLPKRIPDKFNLFIDESAFIAYAEQQLTLIYQEDFASLHDVILYVLVPMINGGNIDYDHPLVAAATQLLLANSDNCSNAFGSFGQNRLYLFKKERQG